MTYTHNSVGKRAMARAAAGYDGQTHYREVLLAIVPAMAILMAAVLFLVH